MNLPRNGSADLSFGVSFLLIQPAHARGPNLDVLDMTDLNPFHVFKTYIGAAFLIFWAPVVNALLVADSLASTAVRKTENVVF